MKKKPKKFLKVKFQVKVNWKKLWAELEELQSDDMFSQEDYEQTVQALVKKYAKAVPLKKKNK